MIDHFKFRNHLCIITELLGMNLYEFIKANKFQGFNLKLTARYASQILKPLLLMKENTIIHCDLKPEV